MHNLTAATSEPLRIKRPRDARNRDDTRVEKACSLTAEGWWPSCYARRRAFLFVSSHSPSVSSTGYLECGLEEAPAALLPLFQVHRQPFKATYSILLLGVYYGYGDGEAVWLSLRPMRARMAASGQVARTAGLPEVQEPILEHSSSKNF